MGILDDTAIFVAIVQQGGFSHAAKHLGLSNGLISRRMALLEKKLGVSLIKRTTRQVRLTPEGELFWQHAQRIQQEIDAAIGLIQTSAKKPKGLIRISAPPYFGRHYLTAIIVKFLNNFPEVQIDLMLTTQKLDLVKEGLDLVIRGAGFIDKAILHDSTMQMRLLLDEKIGLYASTSYLNTYGVPAAPEDLMQHRIINQLSGKQGSEQRWSYKHEQNKGSVLIKPQFNCNDIESGLAACRAGCGIARFTELNVRDALQKQEVRPLLTQYDWGSYHLYAVYSKQQALPKRTRLLLDFIHAHTRNLLERQVQ